MYYVYLHIKETDGTPFYIGKGKKERAYSKAHRSKWWNSTVDKYGYDVIILEDELTESKALEREAYWIKRIGRKHKKRGSLVNMTAGGEKGFQDRYVSDEFRKKCSERMKGQTFNRGRKHSDEVNAKKGSPRGENPKAKKVTYNGVDYGCLKDLWEKEFNNISYSHFNHMRRTKQIIL